MAAVEYDSRWPERQQWAPGWALGQIKVDADHRMFVWNGVEWLPVLPASERERLRRQLAVRRRRAFWRFLLGWPPK